MPVPVPVEAVAAGRRIRPVWHNELGGTTFEVGTGSGRSFVKWLPVTSGVDLAKEAARLEWAVAFTPVPRLLAVGADQHGSWMVLAPLAGENAVSERWRGEPARAVAAVGAGLRALHEALPVKACPFSWSVEDRLAELDLRAATRRLDPAQWHAVHQRMTIEDALALAAVPPPIDRLVVCHGDACAPNTLLAEDGSWSGHVDLGSLGVADRWADLAIAGWSAEWNYGRGWEAPLLEAYGIAPDVQRTRYYRLLWDLGP